MRNLILVLSVCAFAGCGSKSSDSAPVAGVPLSINNPAADRTSENKKPASSVANPAVSQLAEKAKTAVAAGQRAVAIEALSQAIGIEPQNSSQAY